MPLTTLMSISLFRPSTRQLCRLSFLFSPHNNKFQIFLDCQNCSRSLLFFCRLKVLFKLLFSLDFYLADWKLWRKTRLSKTFYRLLFIFKTERLFPSSGRCIYFLNSKYIYREIRCGVEASRYFITSVALATDGFSPIKRLF